MLEEVTTTTLLFPGYINRGVGQETEYFSLVKEILTMTYSSSGLRMIWVLKVMSPLPITSLETWQLANREKSNELPSL